MNIAILGGGLAGLSAAKTILLSGKDVEVTLIEKENEVGGLLRTDNKSGNIFDYGPHLFFHKDELFVNSFIESLNDVGINNKYALTGQWSFKTLVNFPYVYHLYGLPSNVVTDCLSDFVMRQIDLSSKNVEKPDNYLEYCRKFFGDGLTDHFMLNYARKIWTVDPGFLDTDWVGERIILPDVHEMIKGALINRHLQGNYIKEFMYPKSGGTQSFINGFAQSIPGNNLQFELNAEVDLIDLKNKRIDLKNGKVIQYDFIISSIPLPELKLIVKDLPKTILDCLNDLNWFSILLLNYVSRNVLDNQYQWIYYDQDDAIFHRIHYPSKLADNMVQDGYQSIQAEISFSRYRELKASPDNLLEKAWEDLMENGFVDTNTYPEISFHRILDYAYVIMDRDRKKNVSKINEFLQDNNCICCGRFGEWDYIWTNTVLNSGLCAGIKALSYL